MASPKAGNDLDRVLSDPDKAKSKTERLTDAVFPRTDQKVDDRVHETLECLDKTLRKNDVTYTIFGGSQPHFLRRGPRQAARD